MACFEVSRNLQGHSSVASRFVQRDKGDAFAQKFILVVSDDLPNFPGSPFMFGLPESFYCREEYHMNGQMLLHISSTGHMLQSKDEARTTD